jgi:hypothetical protein
MQSGVLNYNIDCKSVLQSSYIYTQSHLIHSETLAMSQELARGQVQG